MPDKTGQQIAPLPKELEDILQQMIDAHEPEENLAHVVEVYQDHHASVGQQTLSELKGLAEGVVPGAWGFIRGTFYDLPKSVIEDTVSLFKSETPEHAKAMIDSIANAPEAFTNATHEERGKMFGDFLGAALTGRYVPLGVKPAVRGAGALIEQTGKKGGWPIRMMGAHQLGSGNPLGAAVMAIPEVLETGGRKLQEWGGKPTAAELNRLPSGARNIDTGPIRSLRLGRPQQNTTPATERGVAYGAMPVEPSTASVKSEANAARLAEIKRQKAELKAGDPRVRESLSATTPEGGRTSVSQTFAPDESQAGTVGGQSIKSMTPDVQARLRAAMKASGASAVSGGPERPPIRVSPPQGPMTKSVKLADAGTGVDQLDELLSATHPGGSTSVINPEGHGTMPTTATIPTTAASDKIPPNLKMGSQASPTEMMADIHPRVRGGIRTGGRPREEETVLSVKLPASTASLPPELQMELDKLIKANPDMDPKTIVEAFVRKMSGQ